VLPPTPLPITVITLPSTVINLPVTPMGRTVAVNMIITTMGMVINTAMKPLPTRRVKLNGRSVFCCSWNWVSS
jgi:hypothetical protein